MRMRRTEQAQEWLRLMKFEEVYERTRRGLLGRAEAAEILGRRLGAHRDRPQPLPQGGLSARRDRYEPEGTEGLYGRRLGRVSARRAPVDEVARVLELRSTPTAGPSFIWYINRSTQNVHHAVGNTEYGNYLGLHSVKHFHEKLVAEHGCERSCSHPLGAH